MYLILKRTNKDLNTNRISILKKSFKTNFMIAKMY
jgi:hypothetical protein